jgi:hypothetical protein
MGEQREVRPAVERKGPEAAASVPAREVVGSLVQPAILGGGAFPSRAIDQRDEAFAGEPVRLGVPMPGLRHDLRLLWSAAAGSKCASGQHGARWWKFALAPAAITPPSPRRPRPRRAHASSLQLRRDPGDLRLDPAAQERDAKTPRDSSGLFAGHRLTRLLRRETDLLVNRQGRFEACRGSLFAWGELLDASQRLHWLPIGEASDAIRRTSPFTPSAKFVPRSCM